MVKNLLAAESSFPRFTNGDCIVRALDRRGAIHRVLTAAEITNPNVGPVVISFDVGGSRYYFDGRCLRIPDRSGTRVPGPLIDSQVAQFLKKKHLLSAFLRKRGFNVWSAKTETSYGEFYRFISVRGRLVAVQHWRRRTRRCLSLSNILSRGMLGESLSKYESVDITDTLHRSYTSLMGRALALFPDLFLCGGKLAIQNPTQAANHDNYAILDLSHDPRIADYHHPSFGPSRDVAGVIVEELHTEAPKRTVLQSCTRTDYAEGTNGYCLVRALDQHGIPYRYLSHDQVNNAKPNAIIVAFAIDGNQYYFDGARLRISDPLGFKIPGPRIDGPIAQLVDQKDAIKPILRQQGLSVPEGRSFSKDRQNEADAYFRLVSPYLFGGLCVKPANAKKGEQVYLQISDLEAFQAAFTAVAQRHDQILVEETVEGTVFRFLCLAGRAIAIRFGRPANVEGDGVHSVKELVELKNRERRLNPAHARQPIRLGVSERAFLKRAGLDWDDVVDRGKLVFLSGFSNLSRAADMIDATDIVHPSYVQLVELAVKQFPGLFLCGPDVIIRDHGSPATRNNYHILELNSGPGFSGHHYPWTGKPRDVAGSIIQHLSIEPVRPKL